MKDVLRNRLEALDDEIKTFILTNESVTTYTHTYHRVISEINRPKHDAKSLSKILEPDRAFTAKIFQLMASPIYHRKNITTLSDAIAAVGDKDLVACLMVFIKQKLIRSSRSKFVRANTRHAVVAGAVMRHAVEELDEKSLHMKNLGFALGLFHNLGELLIHENLPEWYAMFYTKAHQFTDIPLSAIEKEVFGATFAEITALQLSQWDFSKEFIWPIMLNTIYSSGTTRTRVPKEYSKHTQLLFLSIAISLSLFPAEDGVDDYIKLHNRFDSDRIEVCSRKLSFDIPSFLQKNARSLKREIAMYIEMVG